MAGEDSGAIVVSGASSGFGFRTAQVLAGHGYPIVAIARRADRLADLVEQSPGLPIHPVAADIRDAAALRVEFDRLPAAYRDIGAVVNNAGLSRGFGPIQEGNPAAWQEMIDTNIVGLLNIVDLLLPELVKRGRGHVVNVGSIAARYPYLGGNVYGATKAFVHQLTLNMRADLEGTGVRVTCVVPGMARTEFALVRYDGDAERADKLYQGLTPLSAEDVAQAVAWSLTRPWHVNINMIELMPTDQPFSLGFARPTATGKPGAGDADAARAR